MSCRRAGALPRGTGTRRRTTLQHNAALPPKRARRPSDVVARRGQQDPSREPRVRGPAELRGRTALGDAGAERADATDRLREPSRVEGLALDRRLDATDRAGRDLERLADEQHVAARGERGGGEVLGLRASRDRLHLEVVAEEDALEAQA